MRGIASLRMTAVKEFSVELKIGHELGVANSFEAYYFYARAASPGKAGSVCAIARF